MSDVKIYISVDFEGGACIVGQPEMTLTESKQYEFARRQMTDEANAASRGAYEGGAGEVVVDDAHGSGLNLQYDRLDPRVQVLLGTPRRRRFPCLDSSYAGILLIGYHPMAGSDCGVLSHTYSSRAVQNMWLNGRRIGEIGFDAALAGGLGVPTLLVTSCEAGVAEARKVLEKVETFATKKGLSRNCALSLSPEAACDGIRESARRAVELRAEIAPFKIPPPYEVVKEFKFESTADRLGRPFERIGPRKVAVKGDDLFELI